MRPGYNGVKYYSKYDMSVGWALEKAEPIISVVCEGKNLESINEINEEFAYAMI